MTLRLRAIMLALTLVFASAALYAAEADLWVAPLAQDGQVFVTFELSDGLSSDVRDAIQSGLPTTLSYDVELRRGSTAWFDRTIAAHTVTATVQFDNLTRRYHMSRSVDGRVQEALPSDDSHVMQRWMTRFDRVPLSPTSTLEANGEYYVRIRVHTRPHNAWFFWPWERVSAFGRAKFTFIQ